ncbi:MAG: gliding motility-associated C-terminal domain-containing protein, partial [Saprospiraceae bacterium]|nr:gliding motility-associated C-terminal domain-containing protein [Saprospiraceae bacterium]
TAATCGQNNGAINLTVSPAGSYTFEWSNGTATEDLSGISAGTYTVTATNGGGCTATTSATVSNNNTAMSLSGTPSPNTSCISGNGSISLSVTPAGSYNFLWSNGATTQDLTNLVSGAYSVTVTDAQSCQSFSSVTVHNNTPTLTAATTATAATCGQNNGSINLIITPAGAYTFLWSNGTVTEDLSGISAGTYTVTATNGGGCTATAFSLVSGTSPFSSTMQVFVCPGTFATFQDQQVAAGTVRDFRFIAQNGCDSIITLSVTAYPALEARLETTPSCANQSTGTIEALVNHGQAPFVYSLNSGDFLQSSVFDELPSGAHQVVIRDANECLWRYVADILPSLPVAIQVENQQLSCEHPEVVIQPSVQASPDAQLQWTWSDGTHAAFKKVGEAGTYTVEVSDGCMSVSRAVEVSWEEEPLPEDIVYVPNCFAPESNGLNNEFRVAINPHYTLAGFEIHVFDRWGNEMFRSTNPDDSWNGYFRKTMMEPAVFVWYLRVKIQLCSGKIVEVLNTGDVTVIR